MNKLRLVIIFQLAFFAAWAGWLYTVSSQSKAEFFLNTAPVDPRDLLSGTYVALSYDISTPKGADCDTVFNTSRGAIHVQLGPTGETIRTGGLELPLYASQACAEKKPAPDGKLWVQGKRGRWAGRQVTYGIEKFFVSENDPLKNARMGEVIAHVKVDGIGNLRLISLENKPAPAAAN